MKTIPLSQGFVAIVDDEDFERLSAHKWHVLISRNSAYAVRNNVKGLRPTTLRMHREILQCAGEVDHRDGDGLNNRRLNLREADSSMNQANRRTFRKAKYGFRGVGHLPYTQNKGRRWKRVKQWVARITVQNRAIVIGYFLSAEEAALAYDDAARKHFGEFARFNFPRAGELQTLVGLSRRTVAA